jgi:hypothetical protein
MVGLFCSGMIGQKYFRHDGQTVIGVVIDL